VSDRCIADDHVNETTNHPARSFRGSGQVRSNWEQIFEFVPDLTVEILRCAIDGDGASVRNAASAQVVRQSTDTL